MFLYTGKLLGRCMEKAPWVLTYADIGELAFGMRGRIIIAILLYSELYLTCAPPLFLTAAPVPDCLSCMRAPLHSIDAWNASRALAAMLDALATARETF